MPNRRWRHEGSPPSRVPRGAEARRGRRAEGGRAARRGGEDRGGRPVPHRPPHPGGPVGREVRGDAALHARPRERGLDPRGRLRRDQRRGRRHGDRAPVHHVRAVPRLPPRRRHALRERLVPRHRPRRRLRRLPAHQRALGDQARPVAAPDPDRRSGRRRPHGDPRRQEGDPGPRRRHPRRGDRGRRARPHRDPVPAGLHADRDHRHRPERARRWRWPARSAPTTR